MHGVEQTVSHSTLRRNRFMFCIGFALGEDFKILGVLFDAQLRMHSATRAIATEAGWRLQTLMNARQYFSTPELFRLYKSQILSYIESSTPAIYHAAVSVLERVDRVQSRFLRNVGFTEFSALKNFRLAPLAARRDIAMLGALHRITLGLAPPQMAILFPGIGAIAEPAARQNLRYWRPRHNRQLATPVTFRSSDVLQRSVFGLVGCYNRLPQQVVDISCVKGFQRCLQFALLQSAEFGLDNWRNMYSVEWRMPAARFHGLFDSM